MIIYGTYVDGFYFNSERTNLSNLNEVLKNILPNNSLTHLLPIYPSAGDFGFAPNTWSEIRDELGTWDDLKQFTKNRRVILDGIFNHVGIGHEWLRGFNSDPDKFSNYFHSFANVNKEDGPISTRNNYALVKYTDKYHLWQTFNEFEVDINLYNPTVIDAIDKHLSFLSSLSVWGIRLDGVAYLGKELGKKIRHLKGSYDLAEKLRALVIKNQLKVIAQLDCDADALKYFADLKPEEQVPINDMMFSAYFILSLMKNNPSPLVEHVRRTKKSKRIIVRVPRTHDGILLRSLLLEESAKQEIVKYAIEKNIEVRLFNNYPYELNCSGPLIYSIINNAHNIDVILFVIAVTAMFSGISYFYLPFICNFIPENVCDSFEDPRGINRIPVSQEHFEKFCKSDASKVQQLLNVVEAIHNEFKFALESNEEMEQDILILTTSNSGYKLFANFNVTQSFKLNENFLNETILFKNHYENGILNSLGIVLIKLKK